MDNTKKIFEDVKAVTRKKEMTPEGEALRKALLDYENGVMGDKTEKELAAFIMLIGATLQVSEESFKRVIARLLLIFSQQGESIQVVQVDKNQGGSGNVVH